YQNTLGEILEVLFSGSDLHYSIDSQQRVFITRGKALSLDFSPGYFTIEKESTNELAEKPPINAQQERTFAKNRLWEIGQRGSAGSQGTLIGKVLSVDSKEPIIGAIIYARDRPERTITSESGEYSITLPKGRHTLIIQSFGAYQEQRQINLIGDGTLNIDMDDNIIALSE